MVSATSRQCGQATLETTLIFGSLAVLISLVVAYNVRQRQALKHDIEKPVTTASANVEAEISTANVPLAEGLKDNLMVFSSANVDENSVRLEAEGWTEDGRFKLKGKLYVHFTKDGKDLLLRGNMGVVTWPQESN